MFYQASFVFIQFNKIIYYSAPFSIVQVIRKPYERPTVINDFVLLSWVIINPLESTIVIEILKPYELMLDSTHFKDY